MNRSLIFRNKIYRFCFLLFSLFLFIYLLYFLFNADRGIMSYYKFLIKYSLYDKELNILKQKNIDLEDKISRLSTNSLDLDYLDEQLILNTGKIAKDELVINLNN